MLPFLERKGTDLFIYDFKDFSFPAHFHDSLEVIFVENGEIELRIDDKVQIIRQGEIGVIFPNLVHSYERTDIVENNGHILLLSQRLMGEYRDELADFRLKNPVFTLSELHEDCAQGIRVLYTEAREDIRMQKAYAQLFLCRFMLCGELVPKETKHKELLHALVDYMGSHFRENLSLSSVAEALYVSKYTLSGIFSRSIGVNFNDYLNALRINLAMQLIENSDASITDICYEVGFGNVRTFNRAFKKHCGLAPTEYKKNLRHR